MPTLPKTKLRPWIPKKPDRMYDADNSSFYSSKRWRSLRNYFIQKNPLCAQCKRNKIIKGAQCVDHIKPLRLGGSPVDENNLQSLCNNCHDKKSSREAHERKKGIKIYKKNRREGGRNP